jgi:hypothetical protein
MNHRRAALTIQSVAVVWLVCCAGVLAQSAQEQTFSGAGYSDGSGKLTLKIRGTEVKGFGELKRQMKPGDLIPAFGWQDSFAGSFDAETGRVAGKIVSRLTMGGELLKDVEPANGSFEGVVEGASLKGRWTRVGRTTTEAQEFVLRDPASPQGPAMNVDLASEIANNMAGDHTEGFCAKHVQAALEAGGVSGDGHPIEAKKYGPYLVSKGFRAVPPTAYAPARGDVVVIQPRQKGNGPGHIAIYDGSQWISDYRQKNFWGSADPRQKPEPGEYKFYRP